MREPLLLGDHTQRRHIELLGNVAAPACDGNCPLGTAQPVNKVQNGSAQRVFRIYVSSNQNRSDLIGDQVSGQPSLLGTLNNLLRQR